MNREQAKALLPVITAYAEGKEIQKQTNNGNWFAVVEPVFTGEPERYRIKPEPFTIYMNVYSQATGGVVLNKEQLVVGNGGRQGYITVTWEDGQFKSVEFTKV